MVGDAWVGQDIYRYCRLKSHPKKKKKNQEIGVRRWRVVVVSHFPVHLCTYFQDNRKIETQIYTYICIYQTVKKVCGGEQKKSGVEGGEIFLGILSTDVVPVGAVFFRQFKTEAFTALLGV